MRFTVWYDGRLLGTSTLDMPPIGSGSRTGFLKTTNAFAEVWTEIGPVFRELREVTQALFNDPQLAAEMRPDPSLSRDEVGRRVHEALVGNPLAQRLIEAQARATTAGLEVRDTEGKVIPWTHVLVQELTPPEFIPPDVFQQAIADAAEGGLELSWPCYVISVFDWPAALADVKPMSKT